MIRINTQDMSHWIRRLGLSGFIFFLAKGLVWLALPAWLAVN